MGVKILVILVDEIRTVDRTLPDANSPKAGTRSEVRIGYTAAKQERRGQTVIGRGEVPIVIEAGVQGAAQGRIINGAEYQSISATQHEPIRRCAPGKAEPRAQVIEVPVMCILRDSLYPGIRDGARSPGHRIDGSDVKTTLMIPCLPPRGIQVVSESKI